MDFNQKAHIWDKISLSQRQAADSLFEMLEISCNDKVLDIGCGTGYLTERIHNLSKFTVGIDLAENMIKQAKILRPNITFRVGDAEKLDEINAYDWLITNAVTYYFKNIPSTFRKFNIALKPNGKYALQSQIKRTPEFSYIFKMLEKNPRTKHTFSTFKLLTTILDTDELVNILIAEEFTIKEVKTINYETEYTLSQAMDVFKSGAATQYLNPLAYGVELTREYIDAFWDVIRQGLYEQSSNGKITLGFPRCFIIAQKC